MKQEKELKERTRQFALHVIRRCAQLPRSAEGQIIRRHLLEAATLAGARFREACNGCTPKECKLRCRAALDYLEESAWWLELLVFSGMVPAGRLKGLRAECDALIATFASINRQSRTPKRSKK